MLEGIETIGRSIQYIGFIEWDAVFVQNLAAFGLKRLLVMMLGLIGHVHLQSRTMKWADGKHPVPVTGVRYTKFGIIS
jgi:hypothetical protein